MEQNDVTVTLRIRRAQEVLNAIILRLRVQNARWRKSAAPEFADRHTRDCRRSTGLIYEVVVDGARRKFECTQRDCV